MIVVEARDLAPDSRTGSTIVTVRVRDVQDFAPVFVTAQITRNVPEQTTNYLVASLRVCFFVLYQKYFDVQKDCC